MLPFCIRVDNETAKGIQDEFRDNEPGIVPANQNFSEFRGNADPAFLVDGVLKAAPKHDFPLFPTFSHFLPRLYYAVF